jgi:hypothetical protein
MSIHAENHLVESRRILVPHVVLVTNFRVDHTEAAGDTPEDVAALLALDVPEGAAVLLPEVEALPSFQAAVEGVAPGRPGDLERTRVVEVTSGTAAPLFSEPADRLDAFDENLDLVVAATRFLGLDDATIRRGVERARHDVGALRIWKVASAPGASSAGDARSRPGEPGPAYLVNAFAANDPASTMEIHGRVMAALTSGPGAPRGGTDEGVPPCVGLLSLRADRGDRTLQWADALGSGLLERFDVLLVTGLHAAALERRVRAVARRTGRALEGDVRVVPRASAPELTRRAVSELGAPGGVVFGFGNIGGVGRELVEHWSRTGEAVAHGH